MVIICICKEVQVKSGKNGVDGKRRCPKGSKMASIVFFFFFFGYDFYLIYFLVFLGGWPALFFHFIYYLYSYTVLNILSYF